jgi:chaperonin cofactor prefoldin
MRQGFARVESRLDQIYNHIDGFIKLHETLDIEFKVLKEQMRRLEERVEHLEAAGKN